VLFRSGLKPIERRRRDLVREPLSPLELKGIDAVVFDPPRAGAKAQAERLAQSTVPLVVAVSCDPGTLARDLRSLVDGGYAIEAVTPIDQFLFSAHVEAVAVLRRR
jgi:23S rRNA (uracil1939-C5)-methyltransferase